MSAQSFRPLVLGFKVLNEIPLILRPLASAIVACYQRHYPDLRTVYAIGSVAVGEWTEGVSDFDVVGVIEQEVHPAHEAACRSELMELDKSWPHISFINNSVLSLAALHVEKPDEAIVGRMGIIALTGLLLWGDTLDLEDYIPSVEAIAYGRARRAKLLIERYRAGIIISEPFRRDSRLLSRSCVKAAIRVLSSITILRGAVFYVSSHKTVAMVTRHVPEAIPLAYKALAIMDGATSDPDEAMNIAEQAIDLFYRMYP